MFAKKSLSTKLYKYSWETFKKGVEKGFNYIFGIYLGST